MNFLFGLSGCGKSSIAKALTRTDNIENYQRVGSGLSKVSVKVDDNDVLTGKYFVYDKKYMEDIVINKTNNKDIYTILIGNGGKISQCRANYEKAIKDLIPIKNELLDIIKAIDEIKSKLKLKINKTNNLSDAYLVNKMQSNVNSIPTYRNGIKFSVEDTNWLAQGTKMEPYKNRKCPFCSKKLSEARKEKINQIIQFDTKTFNVIKKQEENLQKLNLNIPSWKNKKELNSFNNKLIKYINIYDSLTEYVSFYDRLDKIDILNEQIVVKKPPIELKTLLPNIYEPINKFYENIKEVKAALGQLKSETFKIINQSINFINKKLDILDIPYHFKKEEIDENSKTANFYICHNKDKNEKEMSSSLSDGEQNIIGLLLFLLSHKNSEFLIIDDPASSFDEYRRKVIFNFIFEFKELSTTILVLSHDWVFAKFATLYKNQNKKAIKDQIGKIDFIENYKDARILNIKQEDFGTLNEFVISKLNDLYSIGVNEINYQVAANLRLIYEPIKSKRKDVYAYLSAIVHEFDYSVIIQKLKDKNYDENKILEKIQQDTKLIFKYSNLNSNYKTNIDLTKFSYLEKLFLIRERIDSKNISKLNIPNDKKKLIKEEASNVIHLNMAYEITLNPYKFNIISRNAYNLINQCL